MKRDWILLTGQPGCGKTTAIKRMVEMMQSQEPKIRCKGFYTEEVRACLTDAGTNEQQQQKQQQTKRRTTNSTENNTDSNNDVDSAASSSGGGSLQRIGFDIITIPDGKRGILARIDEEMFTTTEDEEEEQSSLSTVMRAPISRRHRRRRSKKNYPTTGKYFVDVQSFERIALSSLSLLDEDNNYTYDDKHDTVRVIYILDEIGRMELHSKAFQEHVKRMIQVNGIRLLGTIASPRYGHRIPFCDYVCGGLDGIQVHNMTKSNRDHLMNDVVSKYIKEQWCKNDDTTTTTTATTTTTTMTATTPCTKKSNKSSEKGNGAGPDCLSIA